MPNKHSGRFEMVIPPGWMERVDRWRAEQLLPPTRAAAIRHLVEKGLESSQSGQLPAGRPSRQDPRHDDQGRVGPAGVGDDQSGAVPRLPDGLV